MSNTYWVDLETTATGTGLTSGSPYNYSQADTAFFTSQLLSAGDIVYLRGEYEDSFVGILNISVNDGSTDFSTGITFTSWPGGEPWKLKALTSFVSITSYDQSATNIVENGIFYDAIPDSSPAAWQFRNCVFYEEVQPFGSGRTSAMDGDNGFFGCSFIDCYIYHAPYGDPAPDAFEYWGYHDCVFINSSADDSVYGDEALSADTVTIERCWFDQDSGYNFIYSPVSAADNVNWNQNYHTDNLPTWDTVSRAKLHYTNYGIDPLEVPASATAIWETSGYNFGFYESTRLTPGAFYFGERNTYYADIDDSYSTSGNGTSANPWTWIQVNEFWDKNGTAPMPTGGQGTVEDSDDVKIRGTKTLIGSYDLFEDISATNLKASSWNEMWILDGYTNSVSIQFNFSTYNKTLTVDGCALKMDGFVYVVNSNIKFNNCFFYDDIKFAGEGYPYKFEFRGCTITSATIDMNEYCDYLTSADYIFRDTVFYNSILNDSSLSYSNYKDFKTTFERCVMSGTSGDFLASEFVTCADYIEFSGMNPSDIYGTAAFKNVFGWTPDFAYSTEFPLPSSITSATLDFRLFGDESLPAAPPGDSFQNNPLSAVGDGLNYRNDLVWQRWDDLEIGTDAWGYLRKGPGAFWFTNTYYVNLDFEDVIGRGTEGDPWQPHNWYRFMKLNGSIRDGDTIKMKGHLSYTSDDWPVSPSEGSFQFRDREYDAENETPPEPGKRKGASFKIEAWDKATNGPWKMDYNGEIRIGGYPSSPYGNDNVVDLKDGILASTAQITIGWSNLLEGMLLKSPEFRLYGISNVSTISALSFEETKVLGSIICPLGTDASALENPEFSGTSTIKWTSDQHNVIVKDSILDCTIIQKNGETSSGYIGIFYSVLSASEEDLLSATNAADMTFCNCQFSWVRPVELGWPPSVSGTQFDYDWKKWNDNITISGSGDW